MSTLRCILWAMTLLTPLAAQAATLTVTVKKVDSRGGELRVALYTEDIWRLDTAPVVDVVVPAIAPQTVVTMSDVKPGVYGIKTFQDVNRNGEFDRSFIGLPLERYGFSRDARPFFSEPRFDLAKFTVQEGANEITINLQ